jgi:ADP-ribosylation factor-like protein 8
MGAAFKKLLDVFASKKLEVVLVGLENSGKTTLLQVLSDGVPVETAPTIGEFIDGSKY